MKPLIVAHRGASGEAPENTMKAFELAYQQKADGVELDVYLSLDGKVVITHDEDLQRLTGVPVLTRKCTLKVLKQLDFGDGEKIPTLREFFEAYKDKFQIINIEIKSTGIKTDGVEKVVVELVKEYNLAEKVLISSFNPFNLYRLRELLPDLRRGFLIWPPQWLPRQKVFIKKANPYSIHLEQEWVQDPHRFETFKKMGAKLWVWTVNEENHMKHWLTQPVEGIITNFPAKLRALQSSSF